jgi:fumarate hydratase class II
MPNVRKENDSLGVVEVPADRLSDQTQRSLKAKHCHSWPNGHGSAAGWV